jgi:hypothetical protein
MLIAKRYTLLTNVNADHRINYAMPEEPVRVAALLVEPVVFEANPMLIHRMTVFLEDKMHDWHWRNGIFRYSGCVREFPGMLVVVYEEAEQHFCPTCGSFVGTCQHEEKK